LNNLPDALTHWNALLTGDARRDEGQANDSL
jgi:hypothetical protein